jgi:dCTP deaminase
MFAVQPVRIYPGVPICQIFYHQLAGQHVEYESDKYQHNRDIQPSLLYKELNPDYEKQQPQRRLPFGTDRPNR